MARTRGRARKAPRRCPESDCSVRRCPPAAVPGRAACFTGSEMHNAGLPSQPRVRGPGCEGRLSSQGGVWRKQTPFPSRGAHGRERLPSQWQMAHPGAQEVGYRVSVSFNTACCRSLFPASRNYSAYTLWPENSACDLSVCKTSAGAALTPGASGLEGGKVTARGQGLPGAAPLFAGEPALGWLTQAGAI